MTEGEASKSQISIEDFLKLEIKICKILKVEDVEGADKLLKITLDEGLINEDGSPKERVILSGIKLNYHEKEILVGKMVPVITNLAPRTMKGIESNGMMLCPSTAEGLPVLLSPISEVPPGSLVK